MLAIVWWIGGLAFVTLVFIPALRTELNHEPHALLAVIERRFAPQARVALLLTGASGGYLLWALGAWRWLSVARFWWFDAMMAYWLAFLVVLFIVEPLGLLKPLLFAGREPARAWRRFHTLHAILLALAIVVITAAVAGSHGF